MENKWLTQSKLKLGRIGSFEYAQEQPYGYFTNRITLETVIKKIESKEFNADNTLTVEVWASNIVHLLKTYSTRGYKNEQGKYVTDLTIGSHTQRDVTSRCGIDFPAWTLIRHESGQIFVGAKGEINGQSYIGALDHDIYLNSGKLKFAPDLLIPFTATQKKSGLPERISNEEQTCLKAYFYFDPKTRLFLKPEETRRFNNDELIPLLWNTTNNIHPLLMGRPLAYVGGGGDIFANLNNLANAVGNPEDKFGVVLGKYSPPH